MIVTANHKAATLRVRSIAKQLNVYHSDSDNLAELLSSISIRNKKDLLEYGDENRQHFINKGILFSETSGTTGRPLLTPRGQEDLDWNTNNQMLVYKTHVQPATDRVAIIHPGILSPFVEASALALKNLGVGFVRIYPVPEVCDYQRMLQVLRQNEITAIMTTPSLAYKLLYEVRKINGGFENFPVKKFLLTGEMISKNNASNLNKIVGQEAMTIPFVYGSSEVATVMYGVEDCTYRGIDEDFIFELVDPETNQTLNFTPGQTEYTGKLVVSWLRDGLLPILRYDTNDLFTLKIEGNEHIWQALARKNTKRPESLDELKIDSLIYASGIPVYHYEVYVNDLALDIKIISDPNLDNNHSLPELTEAILGSLNHDYSVNIEVNPPQHKFYNFSPSPKMANFKY